LLLVIGGVLISRPYFSPAGPPPPVVNTTGFDPAITAAIQEARAAVERSPRSAAARGHMGMVLLAHDVRNEARECFIQAAQMAPGEPRWPYFLGIARSIDNPAAAVTNLARAIPLFPPTLYAPRLRLGEHLLNLGRLDAAEPHFRAVWQQHARQPQAGLGLGKIANARDRAAEAADFLAAATSDPSTRKSAHRLLVNVNRKLGRTEEADRLARVIDTLPNDDAMPDPIFAEVEQLKTGETAWTDLGDDWIKTGRAQEAAKLLEKAVLTYPKSDRAMFLLGRARLRLGDVTGAEKMLAQAVALAPENIEAQMQLGAGRLTRGRAKEAQPCFRAAIKAKPNLASAWFNLGLSLGNEPSRAECIASFREAIRLQPGLLEAYLGLAIALRADQQPQLAAAELHRALELNPEESMRQKLLAQLKAVEPR
jgi:tetratricopeptide (TPR) repeat protein